MREASKEDLSDHNDKNKNIGKYKSISTGISKEWSISGMNHKEYRSYTNNHQEVVLASIGANEKPVGGDEETKKESSTRSNAYIQNTSMMYILSQYEIIIEWSGVSSL